MLYEVLIFFFNRFQLSLELLRNLGIMYDSTTEQIEQFDQVCHNGIPDPDKALPLLRIYAKLRQVLLILIKRA